MIREFATQRRLGEPIDETTAEGETLMAGVSYETDIDFVRVWYISNGKSFVRATYVCTLGQHQEEIEECEQIVRSIRFESA
jgi:hypothetical protein